MSKNPRFRWVENYAANEWYVIDTSLSNRVVLEIQLYAEKFRAPLGDHIMGEMVTMSWEVIEYGKSKIKIDGKDLTCYDEVKRFDAKSFAHAKTIVNRRMVTLYGKRWKEK
jgi:hypothetical protein